MSKNERLLRISGLIIILRDEFEEINKHPEWCKVANRYLDVLTNKNAEVNEEYNQLFWHLDSVIRDVDEPAEITGELMKILQKDLDQCEIHHEINAASQKILVKFDVQKVKLLDSKLTIS